ncbi:ras and Rab interactor 3 [Tachyglossus aculeatus]|uniref:ras and Rab interactor 3 n=1 Tax=Tachyglossus aculeatus TaxID=9261 RepID=UPI0018F329E1|nr:ras and Rab interactor 3 [Tachyglossus aculeatus]
MIFDYFYREKARATLAPKLEHLHPPHHPHSKQGKIHSEPDIAQSSLHRHQLSHSLGSRWAPAAYLLATQRMCCSMKAQRGKNVLAFAGPIAEGKGTYQEELACSTPYHNLTEVLLKDPIFHNFLTCLLSHTPAPANLFCSSTETSDLPTPSSFLVTTPHFVSVTKLPSFNTRAIETSKPPGGPELKNQSWCACNFVWLESPGRIKVSGPHLVPVSRRAHGPGLRELTDLPLIALREQDQGPRGSRRRGSEGEEWDPAALAGVCGPEAAEAVGRARGPGSGSAGSAGRSLGEDAGGPARAAAPQPGGRRRTPLSSPVTDLGEREGEEEAEEKDEEKMEPSPLTPLKRCLSMRGISVLEKLIKTCPVWLQLGMDREQVREILHQETAGIFLVWRDGNLKNMILSVHFPSLNDASDILEYNIKEEKSILYLEGSVLVFEDVFKLIAFYCVSRDLLPYTLRLPQAILEANSFKDLEIISNLGIGFWDSSLNRRKRVGEESETSRDTAAGARASSLRYTPDYANCSCEIELSVGNDRLWFVNPIFIEDCGSSFPAEDPPIKGSCTNFDLSLRTSLTSKCVPQRPAPPPPVPPNSPPLPPPPQSPPKVYPLASLPASPPPLALPASRLVPSHAAELPTELCKQPRTACGKDRLAPKDGGQVQEEEMKKEEGPEPGPLFQLPAALEKGCSLPAIPPRRRLSKRGSSEERCTIGMREGPPARGKQQEGEPDGHSEEAPNSLPLGKVTPILGSENQRATGKDNKMAWVSGTRDLSGPQAQTPEKAAKPPPIPPPRKKRNTQKLAPAPTPSPKPELPPTPVQPGARPPQALSKSGSQPTVSSARERGRAEPQRWSSPEFQGSTGSLTDSLGTLALANEQDSYSTSSTEEDADPLGASVKKKPSMILDKAKHRLSFVNISNVFSAFLSNNRKLHKKLVELAQDKNSYFGNLVQDYKVYSLDMMSKQSSSTEMLQEIRMMMTQLKSYLLQSTELKSLVDPALHSEEGLETIVESVLYKCVLKPLKEAIYSFLKDIHHKDGALQLLKDNQLVILATTTTDLGVTTSVPEVAVMDKILHKFTTMHKAYSPEKKIAILLKSCKLIYESMALGNPGKPYGADDFLPVLMYVLARSNLTEMLLNVEYMMELMDPALQLGEGSYYLTTTYGALEHIRNYDKITVTRQLSLEVQDSIHRWERRRTLNKARASRSSVQDFISISFLEPDKQLRTLASRPDTQALQLSMQCAEKFEVAQPQDHGLFVLVDDKCFRLADDALPHLIKAYLLKHEPRIDFQFIYKTVDPGETQPPVIKEPNFL